MRIPPPFVRRVCHGLFVLLLASGVANGQSKNLDSLKQAAATSSGKSRALALLELCWGYRFVNADTARRYGLEALDLSRQLGLEDYEAEALNNIGVTHEAQGNYNEALEYELKALDIRRRIGDDAKTANTLNTLGIIYDEKGAYPQALSYYYDARRTYEKLHDDSKIAMVLTNIGIVLRAQKDYAAAADHYRQAMFIYQRLDNKFGLAACHANLGKLHLNLQRYDSAIYYSLLAAREFEGLNVQQFLPTTLSNAAIAYDKTGDWKTSRTYFLKARALHEQYNNKKELSYTLSQLARLEAKLGNGPSAVTYAEEALRIATSIQAAEQKMQAFESLAEAHAAQRNFQEAYRQHLQFTTAKDSLFETERSRQLLELQAQYQTERKDNEIALLNRDNALKAAVIIKNYWLISALALALVAFGVGVLAWRKILQQRQQAVLNEQKMRLREVQLKAVIDSQEQERKRFAADLHDGMGQLVSALQLNIQSIRTQPALDQAVALVDNSAQLLGDIQQEIRNIAFNLMPPVLLKEGLLAAVRELARKVGRASSLKTDVAFHDVPGRLPEVVEISLYRIIQELVSNIVKHGQAKSLVIAFTGHTDELVVTVEDDGPGYDMGKFQQSTTSNGWRTIQTRINLLHGTIDFDTQPGRRNSTVVMHIPLTGHSSPVVTAETKNT